MAAALRHLLRLSAVPAALTFRSPAVHTTTAPLFLRSARSIHGARSGLAIDQHARVLRRIVRDVAAIPHAADHVADRSACRRAVALRQFAPQIAPGKKYCPVAMIVVRQHAVVGDERERQAREYGRPDEEHPREAGLVEHARA